MKNPLRISRTESATSEADAQAAAIEALAETLAGTKSRRVLALETALSTASIEREEATRLDRLARAEGDKVNAERTTWTPRERKAHDALAEADRAVQKARKELRQARQDELPAFRDAIEPHLRDLVRPLVKAADLIDAARAVLSTIDSYTMRNGLPLEPLSPRLADTALLRREIARLPGGETKAAKARKALAEMGRSIGGGEK
jgi:hypothetical protein